MAKKKHCTSNEHQKVVTPEEADRKGKINIVRGIINDNEVQQVIKTALLRETIKNSIFMSAFLVGIIFIFNAIKQITAQGPYFDLFCGMALVFIGAIYLLFSIHNAKSVQRCER